MAPRRETVADPAVSLATQLVGGPAGAALLITGGIGAGRTALARRIAAVPPAPSSGFLSVRPGARAPLWLGRELVRLLGVLGGGAGDLTRPADPAQAARQLRHLLSTPRSGERILLVVDDVHLADPASAELLAELLRAPLTRRPRLALTATADWPDRVPARLAAALAELPGHQLSGLELPEVVEQAGTVLGVLPSDQLAAELLAATGGNLAALHGVLSDALARRTVVVVDERAWLDPRQRLMLPADHPLPHRIDELPGVAARVAELIAIAGPRPVAELATAANLPVVDTRRALDTLRAVGLLTGADSDLRPVVPVLWEALSARAAPWPRSGPQSRVLAALPAGRRKGLVGLAAQVTARGRPLRSAELHALLKAGQDTDVVDTVAAELLPWCGLTPPESIVARAIRHWARIGNWAAIAALPAAAVPAGAVVERARAVLLTSGRVAALSDVDELFQRLANETCGALRAELVAFGPAPETSVAPPERSVLAIDDTAFAAWSQGRWDDVLTLAVADRLAGRGAHALSTAEESTAFAADVWMHRGRPELARRWLEGMTPPPDEAAPRPLIEWARAGLELLLLRPQAAADRMATTLAWMAGNQQRRYWELLLGRQVFALVVASHLDEAADRLAELATEDEYRLAWLRERIALAEYGGAPVDLDVLAEYLTVAEFRAEPFEVARAQLALGAQTGDTELVLAAAAGFGELGATLFQVWSTSAAHALGVDSLPLTRNAPVDELVGDLVAVGLTNSDIAKLLRRNEMYVKRQVSRLLRATNSRHRTELIARTRQLPGPGPAEPPADPVTELLAARPVTMLIGPTGLGRGTTLMRLRKALLSEKTSPVAVLPVNSWMARRERFGLATAVMQALAVAVPGVAPTAMAALAGTDRIAVADAVVGVLRTVSQARSIVVLVDDADALGAVDRVPVGMFAAAANGRFRIVLAVARSWPELADLAGPPVRLPAWGPTETAAAIARRDNRVDEATVEFVCQRTGGDPSALLALLRTPLDPDDFAEALRTSVLDPTAVAPLRELLGPEAVSGRCVGLLAALHGPRLPVVEAALAGVGLPRDIVRSVANRLLDNGFLVSTVDGRLEFGVPLFGDSLAATVEPDDVRAVHRSLAELMLAEHAGGLPVEYEQLAEHIVGAGATIGQRELAEFAERLLPTDPRRVQRWCAALLAARPADSLLAGRAAGASAHALYELARFREAALTARQALDLLAEHVEYDTLHVRTTLVNSLLRIGDYDAALDVASDDGETPRSVSDGLQQARILLLQQRFDAALGMLSGLRPTSREQHIALVTGVRMLAAISADGGSWQEAEQQADPELSPLSREQIDTVRQALAWGDLYSAERAIMPGTLPSPAVRRRPPPSFARLSAAVAALREGQWPTVLALAEENQGAGPERTYVDGLLPALAAEVLARCGQPDEAEVLLRPISIEQPFGHLIGWASAGLRLARGEPAEAVAELAAIDRRCRTLGYLTGRELVLGRWVDACLAAGDRPAALAVSRELGDLASRINTRQAVLYWLISQLATRPDEHTVRSALRLADQFGDRFLAARVRLHEAELGRPDALRVAHAEFRQLGAVNWQRRAGELMSARGMSTRITETIGTADRRLIELIASGATNQEAAVALGVGEKAVEARLTRLYRRTGLRSRVALVREYGGSQRDTA